MKTLEGGYSRNIVLAWRFYLIFQFLWNKRFIMIRKTHCETSPHRFCDVSLPTIFELTRFTAQIWSSQHYFTLKSVQLKLEKQVWVKKSLAYDNGSLVTFYSVKNSMKIGNRDLIFTKLAKLLGSVLCYSFFS